MPFRLNLWLWYLSIVMALGLCVGTGLIPAWGEWYSISPQYWLQTDALLRGRLALSHSPADADFDLAWGEGGVQQLWGLGVPVWQLPFELVARLFGLAPFPDRLALAAAFALVSYLLLRVFVVRERTKELGECCDELKRSPLRLVPLVVLLLFPPMVTFLSGRVLVYEEAVAYAYLFSVALFAGLVAFWRRPTMTRFLCMTFFSGLAGFTRLPSLAYGLATVVIALAVTRRLRWPWSKSLAGIGLFGCGGLLLLGTNWLRFGSPLEFGYGLQLNLMYELRFPAAYSGEPLGSAAKELLGSLFFVRELNGTRFLDSSIVAWQSATPRWRHFYHTTFDFTYLLLLFALWGWMFRRHGWQRIRLKETEAQCSPASISLPTVAALWSLFSFIPLCAFYLRSVAMSSRYVLDFAPALAVAAAGLVWCLELCVADHGRRRRVFTGAVLTISSLWWVYEVTTAKHLIPAGGSLVRHELRVPEPDGSAPASLPGIYRADAPERYGIPKNRQGWRNADGETGSLVILFVDDPREIRLELEPDPEARLTENDFRRIRAKVGWEELKLESLAREGTKHILTFAAPGREAFRHGMQVLFIGLTGPDDFTEPKSRFRLLSVSWRKENPA